jgi:phenylpropionate dioxygenase-like ring-hydroxylating dioxygenase large terminal subunit
MNLSNDSKRWTAVCQSAEIDAQKLRGCVVEGRQLVVWRDGENGAHVWNDFCPHRGAELSHGSVSGGLITCPAHGWRFDINGQMVRPLTSSTLNREAVHACVYAVKEADGMIWASFDQTD